MLEFIKGDTASPPKGFSFLFNRLSKDPVVKGMIRETRGESSTEESTTEDDQSGSGKKKKRVLVKVPPINSPGHVKRKVKFIPKLWEKL